MSSAQMRFASLMRASAPKASGADGGAGLVDLGVVADTGHAEHLRRHATIGVAAQRRPRVVAEDARGKVGLCVEGSANANNVRLPAVEDLVDFVSRADAAHREYRD